MKNILTEKLEIYHQDEILVNDILQKPLDFETFEIEEQ
mgnify:CR=1 FL=1|jgi:hypothetical protein